tara:strand:+ start:1183 stop:2244 length:1062 start_codon:yes stop_codon:yes gene_type:complete
MNLALMQAKINLGNTKENPSVGCIIVNKNNVISAGHTGFNGRPHAEINAINSSKKKIKNSSIFVTLEPCVHYGKTPPCVNTIIQKKIKNVYFSLNDPDPRTFNKSKKKFNNKKIKVFNNINKSKIKKFYKSYIISKKKSLPFLTAKLAVSKDYYSKSIKNYWITNIYSRGRVHLMRSNHDCILTSIKTIKADNPMLTCRISGLEDTSPARIILDKDLNIPISSRIVKSAKYYPTYVFFNKFIKRKVIKLKKFKVKLVQIPITSDKNLDLIKVLFKIKLLGFSRIFLESGVNLTSSFLNKNLVNEFHLFISNKKLGLKGKMSFKNTLKKFLINKRKLRNNVYLFGDKLISYNIK